MIWDEYLSGRLTTLWSAHSAAEIVTIFAAGGYDLTRNAIIGRAHRLGLSAKTKIIRSPRPASAGHVAETIKRNKSGIGSVVQAINRSDRTAGAAIKPVPFTPRAVDAEPPLHLTLLELASTSCRYECSGSRNVSDFTFCGHPVMADKSYCATHAALCHEKPPPRSKQKPFWRQAS